MSVRPPDVAPIDRPTAEDRAPFDEPARPAFPVRRVAALIALSGVCVAYFVALWIRAADGVTDSAFNSYATTGPMLIEVYTLVLYARLVRGRLEGRSPALRTMLVM